MILAILISLLTNSFTLTEAFKKNAEAQVENRKLIHNKYYNGLSYIQCGDAWYFNPVGTLHLFQIESDSSSIRLDSSIHHGTTHGRLLFCHNNQIQMFSGYGMWQYNCILIRFDTNGHEWFESPIEGLDSRRIPYYSTIYNDSIILFSKKHLSDKVVELGIINLQDLTYQSIKNLDDELFENHKLNAFRIYGDKFDYLRSGAHGAHTDYLFDKKSLEFYTLNFMFHDPHYDYANRIEPPFVYAIALDPSGVLGERKFDFSDYQNRFKVHNIEVERNQHTNWYFILLFAVVLIASISFYFVRVRKSGQSPQNEVLDASWIERLTKYNGKAIDAGTLQEALELNYENPDTMRVRMNARIRQINDEKPDTITRVKSNFDSRVYLYKIKV